MTLVLIIAISSITFAQKNEIKVIEKAIKNLNFYDAKSAVAKAEVLFNDMDDKLKAKFYFLKAKSLYANGAGTDDEIDQAIVSLDKLKVLESANGKLKYTEDANEIKSEIFKSFLKKANDAFSNKQLDIAAKAYANIYKVSPKDTVYLFNAALISAQNEDYDTSLNHFIKLKNLGFTGVKISYTAVSKETGAEEAFSDKANRDFAVKTLKTHIEPNDKKIESKRADIVKNIAFIYVSKDENEKALAAIKDAREEYPEDNNLILTEATIYIKLGDNDKSFKLFREALLKDPDNADLNYNVGATAMDLNQFEVAKEAFEKTLSLKKDFSNAALNLSFIEVSKGNALNDEMNTLNNTIADNKRYEELRNQKNNFFKDAALILEKFIENNSDYAKQDVFDQLANIYRALGETAKYKEMKAKVAAIEASEAGNN